MKQIRMTELKNGDIFAHEIKLHGRKSFEVLEMPEPPKKQILCYDRVECIQTKKVMNGYVILLKRKE